MKKKLKNEPHEPLVTRSFGAKRTIWIDEPIYSVMILEHLIKKRVAIPSFILSLRLNRIKLNE